MTQISPQPLTNMMDDALTGNWPNLSRLLMDCRIDFRADDIARVKGSTAAVTRLIADAFNVADDKADIMLRNAVTKADSFDTSPETYRFMRHYWSELQPEDFNTIAGRRSMLVSVLQHRYQLSRAAAWDQVHSFFARAKTH